MDTPGPEMVQVGCSGNPNTVDLDQREVGVNVGIEREL